MHQQPFDLTLVSRLTAARPMLPYLRRHLRAAHAMLKPALGEMSVALIGDRRMAQLHLQFLNLPGPTDVLTFPLEADARGRVTSGEVVVCLSEARRQANRHGLPLEREVLLYALHGLLHLSGFDDRTDSDFAIMHRTEDDILTRLKIGPVFYPAGDSSRGLKGTGQGLRSLKAIGRNALETAAAPPRALRQTPPAVGARPARRRPGAK